VFYPSLFFLFGFVYFIFKSITIHKFFFFGLIALEKRANIFIGFLGSNSLMYKECFFCLFNICTIH